MIDCSRTHPPSKDSRAEHPWSETSLIQATCKIASDGAVATPRQCGRHVLVEAMRGDPLRLEMERFVCATFARVHEADIQSFMPTLLGLCGQRRGVCGVVGFRLAASEPLYLEHYLDQPVEAAIAARCNLPVRRDEIAEVGNLAGSSCRAAIHLVATLPHYLASRKQRWIVFTATSAVRSMLQRFDAPVFELARADGACVSAAPDAWGRYYENDPRVMAGFIPSGLLNPVFARALP